MFASRFAAPLRRLTVRELCLDLAASNHAPAPEHYRVIGLGQSDEGPAIFAFRRSGEHQTRGGNISHPD